MFSSEVTYFASNSRAEQKIFISSEQSYKLSKTEQIRRVTSTNLSPLSPTPGLEKLQNVEKYALWLKNFSQLQSTNKFLMKGRTISFLSQALRKSAVRWIQN